MSFFNPTGRGAIQRMGPDSGFASPFLQLKRPNLLVHAEKVAMGLFTEVSQTQGFLMCPQVHLLQLFDFDEAAFRQHLESLATQQYVQPQYVPNVNALLKSWSTKRAYRSVDFVFCDRATTEVLCGIEIDDPSHNEPARRDADEIKDMMFASAGLPLYRFTNDEILSFEVLPQSAWQVAFDPLALAADDAWLKRKAHFFRKPDPITEADSRR